MAKVEQGAYYNKGNFLRVYFPLVFYRLFCLSSPEPGEKLGAPLPPLQTLCW